MKMDGGWMSIRNISTAKRKMVVESRRLRFVSNKSIACHFLVN